MTLTPYYSDGDVTLYLGDFRDLLLDVIATHGVPDLTVADPCYGETSLDWDRWPDGWPSLIPGNSMWCFGSMRMFLDRRDEFAGWRMSQDVVWEKHRRSGLATDRFARIHEHALHWYRGNWAEIYHEAPKVPHLGPIVATARRAAITPGTRGAYGGSTWEDDGTRWQTTVIRVRSSHRVGAINETEKPRGILEPLIEYGCKPGGLVFDPFAGSCSSLVAARALGRRAIGIELREKQAERAVLCRLSQGVLTFGDAS